MNPITGDWDCIPLTSPESHSQVVGEPGRVEFAGDWLSLSFLWKEAGHVTECLQDELWNASCETVPQDGGSPEFSVAGSGPWRVF